MVMIRGIIYYIHVMSYISNFFGAIMLILKSQFTYLTEFVHDLEEF